MNDEKSDGQRPALHNTTDSDLFSAGDLNSRQFSSRNLQLLRNGSLLLGVFEDQIATIVDWREPTPLPHSPAAVLGVASIQGRMLTVLDLSSLLSGAENSDVTPRGNIIALRGDEQLALAIEQPTEIIEISAQDIQPSSDTVTPIVLGVFDHRGQQISVLDVKELFPAALRGRQRRRRRF